MFGKWLAVVAVFALLAVACAAESVSAPVTFDEYVAAMQAVETRFMTEASDSPGRPDPYPLGGDLVAANELYSEFEERLAGWRAITPPSGIAELHNRLVAALDELQREVGEYLGGEAMSGADLEFETILPAVRPFLEDATAACRALRSALRDAGANVEFAEGCNF